MGYSIDNGSTTVFYAASINSWVTSATGTHTLHVKSWGNQGAGCDTDVPLDVSQAATTNVNVSQPTNGAEVGSPFTLIASGTQCESQPISAFGFSLDNSSNTTIINGTSVNAPVTASVGAHTLHVKSWGNAGASCVTNVAITVTPTASSLVPSNAISVSGIQALAAWQAEDDSATGATSSAYGATSITGSPSLSGSARQFVTTTTNYGGERYDINFASDTSATNFLYDGWVYLTSSASNVANLEFDLNDVMANGQTVIFGFQCDGWNKTWDYTANAGTPTSYSDVWLHSSQSCNPQTWSRNTWHHLQISYSRDDSGNATYNSVWLDGVQQEINATAPSAFALNWGPVLLTNFQVDGMTSGQSNSTIYIDNLTISRW